MHFSDFPAFRVQSIKFPSLTAHLGNQSYSQQDVKQLVEYARLRGVRVVPEVDVPGHASGMRPLAQVPARPREQGRPAPRLHFCDGARQKTIHGDEAGESARVVAQVIAEVAALFSDELFHIGGDETIAIGAPDLI